MTPIDDEEIEKVETHLDQFPMIKEVLSTNWIQTKILNKEDRFKKHVLFWELLLSDRVKRLSDDLSIVKEDANILSSIVSKIKRFKDQDNFDSFRTELTVLAYYKNKETENFKVQYEPSLPSSNKKNDILLKINGEDYYLELFTLLNDNVERNNRNLQHKVTLKINSIPDNPFIISYRLLTSFEGQDIDVFIEFIKEKIEEFKQIEQSNLELSFELDESKKAELWLSKDNDLDKGFVGVIHSEVREMRSDSRLKNWILTKTNQFSTDTKNILVTNLLYPPVRFEDYYNALIGQLALRINRFTMESTPFRHRNGAIFDQRTNTIDSFICFERGNYDKRRKHLNPNATNKIEESIFESL